MICLQMGAGMVSHPSHSGCWLGGQPVSMGSELQLPASRLSGAFLRDAPQSVGLLREAACGCGGFLCWMCRLVVQLSLDLASFRVCLRFGLGLPLRHS